MTITRFESDDRDGGLRIHAFDLSELSLLVGLSGAGKTRILLAIQAVSDCALGLESGLANDSWSLELSDSSGQRWVWSATTHSAPFAFEKENVSRDGKIILERTKDGIRFGDNTVPALKESESLVSLLRSEPEIRPLFEALSLVRSSADTNDLHEAAAVEDFEKLHAKCDTITHLQEDNSPLVERALVLQRSFPARYEALVETFCEIFPSVARIVVDTTPFQRASGVASLAFRFGMRPAGEKKWILADQSWSTGMQRTWLHLLELTLYPRGTVVMIDEYENSLGVNCLPALTKLLLKRAGEIQLILTSHHPYVINHIPVESWLLVQRTGRDVHVTPASSMPRLTGTSHQTAFTRLMSDEAFLV